MRTLSVATAALAATAVVASPIEVATPVELAERATTTHYLFSLYVSLNLSANGKSSSIIVSC